MQTYRELGYSSAPDGVRSYLQALAALIHSKESRHSYHGRLGGPQSWSGRCVEEKNPILSGIQPWSSSM
jgi:hypothetical protein